MTTSIDRDRRKRATEPPAPDADQTELPNRLFRIIRVSAIVTALAGVSCLTAAFAENEWRIALVGSTLIIVSAVACAMWAANAIMADRHEFYQRGKADGWMEGWRGQPPTTNDPLMRH